MKNRILTVVTAVLVAGFAASAGADGAVNTPVVAPSVSTSVAVEAANLYASGMSYYNGTNGVQQDWPQAREQLIAAAHKGYGPAAQMLVTMYNFGYGGPANSTLAAYWNARVQRTGGGVVNNVVTNVNGTISTGDTKTFTDVSTVGTVDASQDTGGLSTDSVNVSADSINGGAINGDAVNTGSVSISAD